MRLYGLAGHPLGHSFSADYFSHKFLMEGISDAHYRLFSVESAARLPELLSNPQIVGLNITIPYKQAIIPLLAELSEEARAIGAVNCIKRCAGGWRGYNTDCYGFSLSLDHFLSGRTPRRALVLGTGGAHRAVCHVLRQKGIEVTSISRSASRGDMTYGEVGAEVMAAHQLIVNTTPLGTWPEVEGAPEIPYELLSPDHILYDLVYNPAETRFMALGRVVGASVTNGLEMLHLQAERSWEIWNSNEQ